MNPTDQALIDAVVKEGSHRAFAELVKRYQSPLRYSLRQLTGWNEALAGDLAQETFIKAHSALSSFQGKAKFSSWLYRIAYNLMLSQGGVTNLAHSRHDMEMFERWSNALQLQGVDAEMLSTEQIQARFPALDCSPNARHPVWGGFIQHRGGVVRHDAVAWGFARAASALGVDIIQNCEVTDIKQSAGRIQGVQTSRGMIRTDKLALCVAGHSTVLAAKAGLPLPISSQPLQAMVSEPVKPVLNGMVISPIVHAYVSQSDRGEILLGGGADRYPSYGQRGNFPLIEETVAAMLGLFPSFSRLKLMRQWAGIVDITPDTSPIMGLTPISGLYLSGGWGTGGFKAIPAGGDTMAYTIANNRPHELIEPFGLERFVTGALVDEGAASGVAH